VTREIAPVHPPRKRIRLDADLYGQSGVVCSITIATKDRLWIFDDAALAEASVAILRKQAMTLGAKVYAYCFMPDHVHLLLAPSDSCDLVAFVAQFKNLVQRAAWRLGLHGTFWQKRFWDHFLRQDEDIETVVHYILNNPVRAGLVSDWRDYPYSGSLVWETLE
jgi:putative transposase